MKRVIKVARRAPIVAVAHHACNVQIWNLRTGERLLDFETVYDGMNRFAIDQSGNLVVAANWHAGTEAGVACYSAKTGDILWQRPDLGQVQRMRFSEHGPWIWCDVESQPVQCLDAHTGVSLTIWPGAQQVFDGSFSPRLLVVGAVTFAIGRIEAHIEIPRANNSFRDAAFISDGIILCEMDVVRCVSIESGEERWRHIVPGGDYMTRISFQDDQFLYGVRSSRPGPGRTVLLIRFARDGADTVLCSLGSNMPYDGFGDGVFVNEEGQVFSLQTGNVQSRLAFS